MITLTENNNLLGYRLLERYPNIFHFTTTRHGGCSKGYAYASFNCSPYCGDDMNDVKENQQLLLNAAADKDMHLVIPKQTHSDCIRMIDTSFLALDEEKQTELLHGIDALITDVPHQCLCISTADCIPLLLFDTKKKVIAAIHAGWRGTVQYITAKTIAAMIKKYNANPKDIIATIGPGISLPSFEVGDEVYHEFQKTNFPMERMSMKNDVTGKYHIDLWEANRWQLQETGVLAENIETAGICTYKEHHTFFSARRLGINSGRILSGIMLR